MPPWYDGLGRRAYDGRCQRTGGPWRAPGEYGTRSRPGRTPRSLRARRMGKARPLVGSGLGRCGVGADAEKARRTGTRDVSARQRSGRQRVKVPVFELEKLHFLNRSAQNFEYESCRSHYPLQLSQRPQGVLLNSFGIKSTQSLNAIHCQ
jgi:hypothetical protein